MSPNNARSGASWLVAILLLALPLAARAGDKTVLRPTLDIEQGYDSNIYNRDEAAVDVGSRLNACPPGYERNPNSLNECLIDAEEDSLITRVTPSLWLENRGDLGYARAGISATGRSVYEDSELSGIDTRARFDFDRRLAPRLRLFGDGLVEHLDGYEEIRGVDFIGTNESYAGELFQPEQPERARDNLQLGFVYELSPRTDLRVSGFAGRLNFERIDPLAFTDSGLVVSRRTNEFRDRDLYGGTALLTHQLTPLDELSLVLNDNRSIYQDLGSGETDSDIWSARVGWQRNWSSRWVTSASLGVSNVETQLLGAPSVHGYAQGAFRVTFFGTQFVSSSARSIAAYEDASDSGTGLVGSLVVQRIFARSVLELSYRRDTRSTGGAGRTDFDVDSFGIGYTHRLAERVTLRLNGDYQIQKSVSDEIPAYAATVTASEQQGGLAMRASCPAFGGAARQVGSANITIPTYDFFGNVIDTQPATVPTYQCFGGSSEERHDYTTLSARIDWQLRRRVTSYLVVRYYRPVSETTLGSGPDVETEDFDKLTVGVGFNFAWDMGL